VSRPPRFIVAEASKGYVDGVGVSPGLLSQRFEKIINTNWARGYRLHSWEFSRIHGVDDGHPFVNETIIAVFERLPTSPIQESVN